EIKRTCLYDFHVKNGGKMVPFAGWDMPVQYKDSISESHKNVRTNAGIFDVSHMLQTKVTGKDRVQVWSLNLPVLTVYFVMGTMDHKMSSALFGDCGEFIESLVVGDIAGLNGNQGTLSLYTNDKGGIIDDLIVNETEQGYLYTQAERLRKKGLDVQVEVICNGLIALQGPGMVKTLQPGLSFDMSELPFMTNRETSVYGIDGCRVTRCGYTGEDGVEISVDVNRTEELVEHLLHANSGVDVRLTGLGARDSLRLEAGLCLYGNDIDEDTTPIEATLAWTIGKRRKAEGGFPGSDIILQQIKDKPKQRRVGFTSTGPPVR
ncbi:GCST-like protein, partial [Mya arenaria]